MWIPGDDPSDCDLLGVPQSIQAVAVLVHRTHHDARVEPPARGSRPLPRWQHKRQLARSQLNVTDAQGVLVARRSGGLAIQQNLRRHVRDRADLSSVFRVAGVKDSGQTEVADLRLPARDQDIQRLDVTVDNALLSFLAEIRFVQVVKPSGGALHVM